MFDAGVSGYVPMSTSTLVVACWIRRSGSPSLRAFFASPQFQWLVPVETTSAPLEAVYLTMFEVAEPGEYTPPASCRMSPLPGEPDSVITPGGSAPLLTRASHSQPSSA